MATLYSDNFNRADADLLGGNWVENSGDWDILTNQCRGVTGGNLSNTTDLGTANYEIEAVITFPATGNKQLKGRWTVDTDMYAGNIVANTSIRLFKIVSGSYSEIGSYTATINTPCTLKLSMNGTTIKVYEGGTERISLVDSDVAGPGYFGFSASGVDNQVDYDDCAVYDFAAGGATQDNLMLMGVG